jgi:predicted acyl esterase
MGDPYDVAGTEDAIMTQLRRGLTEFRSSYYQDDRWAAEASGRKVAIFSIQGWTDDLFPAVESFREFRYLKRLDPNWPVAVALGDVGHPRSQNKASTWHWLNRRAYRFLRAQIGGSHDQRTGISSESTSCTNSTPSERIRAQTTEDLAHGTLTVAFAEGKTLSSAGGTDDPDGLATDPVAGSAGCRVSVAATSPGRYTGVSQPLPALATYIGLGVVRAQYTLVGGTTATLDARLWDVAPSGRALFVDRGTYRIDVPAYDSTSGILELPLFGNHWPIAPGHRIRLDLTQVDTPFARASNVASTIQLSPPTLTLPIREPANRTIPGG